MPPWQKKKGQISHQRHFKIEKILDKRQTGTRFQNGGNRSKLTSVPLNCMYSRTTSTLLKVC